MEKKGSALKAILAFILILVAADFGAGFIAPYTGVCVSKSGGIAGSFDNYVFVRENYLTYMYHTNDAQQEDKYIVSSGAFCILSFMAKNDIASYENAPEGIPVADAFNYGITAVSSDGAKHSIIANGSDPNATGDLSSLHSFMTFVPRIPLGKAEALGESRLG